MTAGIAVLTLLGGIYAYLQTLLLLDVFGDRHNLSIVRDATRVDAYRLVDPFEGHEPDDEISVNPNSPTEYKVSAGPVSLSSTAAAAVANALASKNSYAWEDAKACGPIYGVKLSFVKDDDHVDAYFCFVCNTLVVVHDGQVVGGEDFDPARSVYVRAAKAAFPNDTAIQNLKE